MLMLDEQIGDRSVQMCGSRLSYPLRELTRLGDGDNYFVCEIDGRYICMLASDEACGLL